MTLDYTAFPGRRHPPTRQPAPNCCQRPPGPARTSRTLLTVINNSILSRGGTPPATFQTIMTPCPARHSLNALTQFDGDDATGAETSAFELLTQFLDLLLDPSAGGRQAAAAW